MIFDIQIAITKDFQQDIGAWEKEETATTTPRSLSNSYDESSNETPRSATKSVDFDEPEDSAREQEEYYAFLRELAGSFDNSYDSEDEESESGSEDEAGDEEEDKQPNNNSGLTSPRRPVSGRQHQGGSCAEAEEDDRKDAANSIRSASSLASSSTRPSEGDGYGLDEISEAGDDEDSRRYGAPDPSQDFRGPVEDDYDVVQAIHNFKDENPREKYLQQREDLRHAISMRMSQAVALAAPAENTLIGEELQAHYARVRQALLTEAQELEAKLAQLDTEEAY